MSILPINAVLVTVAGTVLFSAGCVSSSFFSSRHVQKDVDAEYLESIHKGYGNKVKLVEALKEENDTRVLFIVAASLVSDLDHIGEVLERLPKDRHLSVWGYAFTYQNLLSNEPLSTVVQEYGMMVPEIKKEETRNEVTITYTKEENSIGDEAKRKLYRYRRRGSRGIGVSPQE
jgi:hypothetical protein